MLVDLWWWWCAHGRKEGKSWKLDKEEEGLHDRGEAS